MPVAHDKSDRCWFQSDLGHLLVGDTISQADCRLQTIPSVPSDNVPSFCSNASICDATAALRSRNSRRFSSSAFFSLTRATNAGDCPADDAEPAIEGCRMCGWIDLAGKDMTAVCLVVTVDGGRTPESTGSIVPRWKHTLSDPDPSLRRDDGMCGWMVGGGRIPSAPVARPTHGCHLGAEKPAPQ